MLTGIVLPGDIVVVRSPGFFAGVIRFGEGLQGKPSLRNHVAMVHHITNDGVVWFLEGRPGGLGWHVERPGLDTGYLSSKWTVSNAAQPRTPAQRVAVCSAMLRLIGMPYDWEAIEGDAAMALHMPELWPKWGGAMPGHVVCSSSAAWAYHEVSLDAPEVGGGRFTEPADWDQFIEDHGWDVPAAA